MSIELNFYKNLFRNLFSDPCSVKYWDGSEEHYGAGDAEFRIIINEPIPKSHIFEDASLAFGESYMQGRIEIEGSVEKVIESLYNNKQSFIYHQSASGKLLKFISNGLKKSKENVCYHYDIGNDFYRLWLDETMSYSCAYFESPGDSLSKAQMNKIEHTLRKLNLREGQRLLDIGCGWGELIITAAQKYRIRALGITLSEEQYHGVRERIRAAKLSDMVEVKLLDYREIKDQVFDRVVSVGMLEHVGREHLGEYFATVHQLLANDGVSLLHSITGRDGRGTNSWIDKYIFPGGYIPTASQLIQNMELHKFYLLDAESLRTHYTRTLQHWAENFERALPEIRKSRKEEFIRMWRLYLNSSAASFHTGNLDVHQLLFSKGPTNHWPKTRAYMYDSYQEKE